MYIISDVTYYTSINIYYTSNNCYLKVSEFDKMYLLFVRQYIDNFFMCAVASGSPKSETAMKSLLTVY
jgi:hypothetical protein